MAQDLNAVVESYYIFVEKLFKKFDSEQLAVLHSAVGCSTEAGEFLDAAKKYWVYNKPLDRANAKEEIGDMLFYIFAGMNVLGFTLEDVLAANYAKLIVRYPTGYSDALAQARLDKKP